MDELSMIRAFLQVVEDGSFSATARKINGSVSSVARLVATLERKLDVRLLNRTTRTQRLTEIGKLYYEQMASVMRDINRVNSFVAAYNEDVRGTLRVNVRTSTSRLILAHLSKFLCRYPEVKVSLTLSDKWVDLIGEGVDVAVWLGPLQDSVFKARRLTRTRRVVCAATAYLDQHPEPRHPDDLRDHNCIAYVETPFSNDVWEFRKDGASFKVPIRGNFQTGTPLALYDAVVSGIGIGVVQEWWVSEALKKGVVRKVMPDFDPNPPDLDLPLYAIYPHGQGLAPKTRAFVDFLVTVFKRFDRP